MTDLVIRGGTVVTAAGSRLADIAVRGGVIKAVEADLTGVTGGAAEVIEPPTSGDRITFGSTVLLEEQGGKEVRYQIVGSDEAEPANGRISIMSPALTSPSTATDR